MHMIKERRRRKKQEGRKTNLSGGDEAPFYTLGPLTTDIGLPRLRSHHQRDRRGNDRWYGCAMLCYVTPKKKHLGLPNKKDVKRWRHRIQDRRPRPPISPIRPSRRAIIANNAISKARFEFRWGKINSIFHSIPETALCLP